MAQAFERKRPETPHGNKEFNALRRLITTNYDIDAIEMTNPFARIRLKDEVQVSRLPFDREQIIASVKSGALGKLAPEFLLVSSLGKHRYAPCRSHWPRA